MRFENDGMSLWFDPNGTVREGIAPAARDVTITIGVEPADASNRVELRYRVNDGPIAIVPADASRHVGNAQYFIARLPAAAFRSGDTVRYTAVCSCAGKQVPSSEQAKQFDAAFHVNGTTVGVADAVGSAFISSPATTANLAAVPAAWARPPAESTRDNRASESSATFSQPGTDRSPQGGAFIVMGQVQAGGAPAAGIYVQAFDKDLRREQSLGEAITTPEGHYEISYNSDQFRRAEKRTADLIVRAFSNSRVELGASEIFFKAPAVARIDLSLTQLPETESSEYEGLLSQLAPVVENLFAADWTDEDVVFLTGETGIDRQLIDSLRLALKLRQETGLPAEIFYALSRQGLAVKLESLASLTVADLHRSLQTAIDQKTIPIKFRDQLDGLIRDLKKQNYLKSQLKGRLLSQTTGTPLSGFTVRLLVSDADSDPEVTSQGVTDIKGFFTIVYSVPPVSPASRNRKLRLKILTAEAQEILEIPIEDKRDGEVVEIRVPDSASLTVRVQDLAAASGVTLPEELRSFLESHNIHTLSDIRRAGGLGKLEGLPLERNHPSVRMLEAHADLNRLLADTQFNASLIEKGFECVADVAMTSRSTFVRATREAIGDFEAAQIHVSASAQTDFLNNVIAGISADQANGFKSNSEIDIQAELFSKRCDCRDCESALSPAAYLVDLADYVVGHIVETANNRQITMDDLSAAFHQSFGDLPADCHAAEQEVSQARLCIEVLRSYLKSNPPSQIRQATLEAAERDYRIAAYTRLLTQTGTSFEEIRQLRGASEAKRQGLADRLGFVLKTQSPDQLDQLFLDPAAPPTDPKAITEQTIERIFGLSDTSRDPLSRGPLIGNSGIITRWSLDGIDWERNADEEGTVFVSLTKPSASRFSIELYKDRQRTHLVGSANVGAAGIVTIAEENGSGLSGIFRIEPFLGSHTNIEIGAIPLLLTWRLQGLRMLWTRQDSADTPLIDPDIIGPSDLRDGTSGPAFTLWQVRDSWVRAKLTALQSALRTVAGFDSNIASALGVTGNDLLSLATERRQGRSIDERLAHLKLTNAGFTYLLGIREMLQGNLPVLEGEWNDVSSILVQAQKLSRYKTWREEEQRQAIILSPDYFKVGEVQSPLNPWRATTAARRLWLDTLQSRIDQQTTITDQIRRIIKSSEEELLPALRDALVAATNVAAVEPALHAERITKQLLIDARNDGCQCTTRTAQAIETLQQFVSSTRMGQLPDYSLADADRFEAEWKWIGSYAAWRSMMLVFLYPENISLPGLRLWQTPAFKLLIENLRSGRNLTPAAACERANHYAEYFQDVCTLQLEASCQSRTRLHDKAGCGKSERGYGNLFYMFGRGGLTNQVYWSAFDPQDSTGYAQSFWQNLSERVNGFDNIVELLGAVPYQISPTHRFIFLFATKLDQDSQKLVFARYDLENQRWEEGSKTLSPPGNASSFSAVLKQTCREDEPPHLAIAAAGAIFDRRLKSDGSDWTDADFRKTLLPNYFHKALGMVAAGRDDFYLLVGNPQNGIVAPNVDCYFFTERTSSRPRLTFATKPFSDVNSIGYLGAFPWPGTNDLYLQLSPYWETEPKLYRISVQGPNYNLSLRADDVDTRFIGQGLFARSQVVSTSGLVDGQTNQSNQTQRWLAFSGGSDNPGIFHCRLWLWDDGIVELVPERAAPLVWKPFEITAPLQSASLRKTMVAGAFADNAEGPASNLVYLEEAYYFVPIQIALQLQQSKQYIGALDWFRTVYDYTAPEPDRKIYYGLKREETLQNVYERGKDWLLDPLNPHSISATRRNAYTRFTLFCIIKCLLDLADNDFTTDTSESVPRARGLYRTVLELLETSEIKQEIAECEDTNSVIYTLRQALTQKKTFRTTVYPLPLSNPILEQTARAVGEFAKADFRRSVSEGTQRDQLDTVHEIPDSALSPPVRNVFGFTGNSFFSSTAPSLSASLTSAPERRVAWNSDVLSQVPQLLTDYIPLVSDHFCIPPNPILKAARLHAELNLLKIRTCRNIAGAKRHLDPFVTGITSDGVASLSGQVISPGTAVLHPTIYRYSSLIERAKQLVELASQMEAAMLAALEKRDAAAYALLNARQDLALAQAGVQLQELRVAEANDGVSLAHLQQFRAQMQVSYYQQLIETGLNSYEEDALQNLELASSLMHAVARRGGTGTPGLSLGFSPLPSLGISFSSAQANTNQADLIEAASYVTGASAGQLRASFERRAREWVFQRSIAQQDVSIGGLQVQAANDHVLVTTQERTIAGIHADNAQDTIEFLTNRKFGNVELYDWMSGILERVYGYFLQQATAMARVAENQLTFERQEVAPAIIQSDYWEASSDNSIGNDYGRSSERHGLTGSARLLQDIYRLDQYALETDKRKLQLSKTISLAQLAPAEFQRFRQTGVLAFATPMEMFDRDFPGHYLRLIKRIRTSVIALIPPTQGIHAMLSTSGLSRVVIGGDLFQTFPIRRDPEFVALTSPSNSTGLFELEPQSEMLLPFEGRGVDTTWEFRLPRAANLFDYRTIADVLITVEYTALHSFYYYQQVVQTLKPEVSSERPFSFRTELSDQWYDLHNPDQTATPMKVRFSTTREDFPPNLDDLKIQQVVLYFAGAEAAVPATLLYKAKESGQTVGGSATSIDGVISTRRGNAASWTTMIGSNPIGEWELSFADTSETRSWFQKEEIKDIFFNITFTAHTPPWPI